MTFLEKKSFGDKDLVSSKEPIRNNVLINDNVHNFPHEEQQALAVGLIAALLETTSNNKCN